MSRDRTLRQLQDAAAPIARRAAAARRNRSVETVRSAVLSDVGAERLPGILAASRKLRKPEIADRSMLEAFADWLSARRGTAPCHVQLGLFDTEDSPADALASLADGVRALRPTPEEMQRFVTERSHEAPAMTDYSMLCAVHWFLSNDAMKHMLAASSSAPFRGAAVESYDILDRCRASAMDALASVLAVTPGSTQCAAEASRLSLLFEASPHVQDLSEPGSSRAYTAMLRLASSVADHDEEAPSVYVIETPAGLSQGQILRIAQAEGLPVSPNQVERRAMLKQGAPGA